MSLAGIGRVSALSFALAVGGGAAFSQESDPNADIAAARLATREQPASFDAWTRLAIVESMQAVMQSATNGAADPQAAGERRFREILAEWKAARPRDGGPYLAEIYREPDSPARQQKVLDLAARFPEDPAMLEHASRILTEQGKPTQAMELLESFVEAHPDRARGFELLAAAYELHGNRPAANDVAADWLRRFPGDPAALYAWLRTVGAETSPAALEEAMASALPAVLEKPLTEQTRQLCHALSERRERGLASSGEACLEQVAERGATPEVRESAAQELRSRGAASGDGGSALAAIAALPPGRRLAATKTLASRLRAPEDCARIVALFAPLAAAPTDAPTAAPNADGESAEAIAHGIAGCSGVFAARELYVGLFATAPAESLPRLILAWRTRVNGRYIQDLPVDRLVPIVQRRWAAMKGDPAVAEALDLLYEAGGLRAERRELLLSEAALDRWPRNPRRLIEFAEEEILLGNAEVGVKLLQGALARSPDDARAFRACSEALLILDRDSEAQALAERGLASESQAIRAQSHLTFARLAMRDENVDAALTHYRKAIDAGAASAFGGGVRELSDEYLFVLAHSERKSQLPALAEELCAGPGLREPGQSVETCVGAALGRAGEVPAAAKYLESALDQAAQKPELFHEAARALAAAGDWAGAERVIRERIALDPVNEGGWAELGLVLMRAEDVQGHKRVVTEAERTLGGPSMLLRYQQAKLQLATGDARGAVETLLAMQKLRPDLAYLDGLLREAYTRLGAEP